MLRILVTFVVFTNFATAANAGEKADKRQLPFPPIADTWQSLDRALDAVAGTSNQLFTFSDARQHIVTTPFAAGRTRTERFGKITDSKRHDAYQDGRDDPAVRGAVVAGNRLLVMNAKRLTMISVFIKDMKETIRRTIPIDLIRPPRDRVGEAPEFEVKEYRAKIKREFAKSDRLPFAGMAALPDAWRKTKNELLVLSRMPSFPLIILGCDPDEPSQCKATRGCFTHFPAGVKPQDLRGVATYGKNKWVLVGDPSKRQIHILKYNSCHDVRATRSLKLPDKLKNLRNLWVSESGDLFVVTDEPDWYHNASLYTWPEAVWTSVAN